MECDICLTVKKIMDKQLQAAAKVNTAKFAVKDEGVLLVYCTEHMEEFHNMHETVLLVADTRVPYDGEPD